MNIEYIAYHIPDKKYSLLDLCRLNEMSSEESVIYSKLMGLKQVRRDKNRTPYDNIVSVLTVFLKNYPVCKNKIRYVFIAHTAECIAPFSFNLSCLITEKFGFSDAICFGSSVNKCASSFHFISVANKILPFLNYDELVLIINADTAFTDIIKTIPGCTVMGDAASILLLSNYDNHNRFIDSETEIDSRFYAGIFGDKNENLLFQSVYTEILCKMIKKILIRNQLAESNIQFIYPHNVNVLSWKFISQKIGIPLEKIYLKNVSKLGHCFGSDPFINLKDGIDQNLMSFGDYYLIVTVGLGATFSVMLFQY